MVSASPERRFPKDNRNVEFWMLNFELGSGDLEIMNDELGSEASGENGKLKIENGVQIHRERIGFRGFQ